MMEPEDLAIDLNYEQLADGSKTAQTIKLDKNEIKTSTRPKVVKVLLNTAKIDTKVVADNNQQYQQQQQHLYRASEYSESQRQSQMMSRSAAARSRRNSRMANIENGYLIKQNREDQKLRNEEMNRRWDETIGSQMSFSIPLELLKKYSTLRRQPTN